MEAETRAELAKLREMVEENSRLELENRGHLDVLYAEVQALRLLVEGLIDGMHGRGGAANGDSGQAKE